MTIRPGAASMAPIRALGFVVVLALLGLPGLVAGPANGATRAAVTVSIAPAADAVERGTSVKVRGSVRGPGASGARGAEVLLQRRTATNKWRTVGTSTVTRKSNYVVRFTTAGGDNPVRALVRQTATSRKGVSPVATIQGLAPGSPKVTGAKPTIRGGTEFGSVLTAKRGTWRPAGAVTFRYQWLRNGSPIAGAAAATHRIQTGDIGKRVSVRVTGSATGHFSKSRVSDPVTPRAATFSSKGTPTITGTNVGMRLNAWTGSWSPKPSSFRYQWLRNSTAIPGATKTTYTISGADHGARLRVRVTARRSGYVAASRTSAYTPVINVPVARILADTNAYRAKHGKRALKISNGITNVARAWATTLHDSCTFRHNPNFAQQIPSGWTSAAENIAAGQYSSTVVAAWINSPTHRANLLGNWTHIGIGYHSGSKCYQRYFVQNFANYP